MGERKEVGAKIRPCSRCGITEVVNPKPHDDIVVCEKCMHQMWDEDVRQRMAEAWDAGHRFTGYEPERGENPYRSVP